MSIPKTSAWNWKIYLGSNLIAEGGCGEWKPWANTIAYYPLKTDFKDYSWNWYDMAWNASITTIGDIQCTSFNWSTALWATISTVPQAASPRTISCRVNIYWSQFQYLRWYWTSSAWKVLDAQISSSSSNIFSINTAAESFGLGSISRENWLNIIFISYDKYNVSAIINWQKTSYVMSQSRWLNTEWDYFLIWAGIRWTSTNRFSWHMNEFIIENKWWSDNEAINYYNQTKSEYWIS